MFIYLKKDNKKIIHECTNVASSNIFIEYISLVICSENVQKLGGNNMTLYRCRHKKHTQIQIYIYQC
jgi:hypothetical protein